MFFLPMNSKKVCVGLLKRAYIHILRIFYILHFANWHFRFWHFSGKPFVSYFSQICFIIISFLCHLCFRFVSYLFVFVSYPFWFYNLVLVECMGLWDSEMWVWETFCSIVSLNQLTSPGILLHICISNSYISYFFSKHCCICIDFLTYFHEKILRKTCSG